MNAAGLRGETEILLASGAERIRFSHQAAIAPAAPRNELIHRGDFDGVNEPVDASEKAAGLKGNLLLVKSADVTAERDFSIIDIDREPPKAGAIGFRQLGGDLASEQTVTRGEWRG